MMRHYILSFAALTFVSEACPPHRPVPVVDASDIGPRLSPLGADAGCHACSCACANLAQLRCVEGLRSGCVATCEHTVATGITDLHLECLASKKTRAEVRGCKSVDCPENGAP